MTSSRGLLQAAGWAGRAGRAAGAGGAPCPAGVQWAGGGAGSGAGSSRAHTRCARPKSTSKYLPTTHTCLHTHALARVHYIDGIDYNKKY